MRILIQKIILPVLLLTCFCVKAQVKFSASVTPSEIGKDEYTELKLVVENAREVQQIVPPNLQNFTILSGPNQESGMTMINGTVKKYIALSFIIQPKTTGILTIGTALAKADGVDLKSNTVKLRVTTVATGNNNRSNIPSYPFGGIDPFEAPAPRSSFDDYILRKGENPVNKIKKNMFVRVEVDKKSVYVGEPLVASYKLYTRLRSESNMVKNPSFNGFSVLDMQQADDVISNVEHFEGREYNVYVLRKVQLYPLMAGSLELGVAEIENNVRFIKAAYANQQTDMFRDLFRSFSDGTIPPEGIENQKVTLQSKPLSILVKAFPTINKPENFKGAVGDFSIEAKIDKASFSTDDAGKMAVIISGKGNLQLINAPEIVWPQGVEGFESKATDDLYRGTIPVSGRKIFEYPVTVSKAGTYRLQPVDFSYFDTHDARYKTVTSSPINFTVTRGTGKSPRIIAGKENITRGNYLAKFFSNRLRVVSLLAVLIITGLIIWLKRDSKKENTDTELAAKVDELIVEENEADEKQNEEILLGQLHPLAVSEEYLQRGDGNLFFTQLNLELKNYLSKKLLIQSESLNHKNITEQLDAKGVSNETSVQLQELIDEIEWQLYTPMADNEKMREFYDKANDLIGLLNTYRG